MPATGQACSRIPNDSCGKGGVFPPFFLNPKFFQILNPHELGGGSKYVLCSLLFGEDFQLD